MSSTQTQTKIQKGLCQLLRTLSTGTPLVNITVDGAIVPVTNFITINAETNQAFFRNGNNTVVANCREIDSIEFRNV